jgi:uncharacterized spore protein YtfJ
MADVPFDPATVVRVASDILSVKRVFGEPFERDGVTIIPVAKVIGGSGGGGLGVHVRPVGVYVVDSHGVHGHPALDVKRVILGRQVLAALVGLAVSRVLRGRR